MNNFVTAVDHRVLNELYKMNHQTSESATKGKQNKTHGNHATVFIIICFGSLKMDDEISSGIKENILDRAENYAIKKLYIEFI